MTALTKTGCGCTTTDLCAEIADHYLISRGERYSLKAAVFSAGGEMTVAITQQGPGDQTERCVAVHDEGEAAKLIALFRMAFPGLGASA